MDEKIIKIGKKRLSKNYQRQLEVITGISKIENDNNKNIRYDFTVRDNDLSINFYSQPIFDIYRQVKFISVKDRGNKEYFINMKDLDHRGSCFLYLLKNRYKAKCALDKKQSRSWA